MKKTSLSLQYPWITDEYSKHYGVKNRALIKIYCQSNHLIMIYQKDGNPRQRLYRCYFNRIRWPQKLADLQTDTRRYQDLPDLYCDRCHIKVGTPMQYPRDKRIAFGLLMGMFKRKKVSLR